MSNIEPKKEAMLPGKRVEMLIAKRKAEEEARKKSDLVKRVDHLEARLDLLTLRFEKMMKGRK